jgi:hypothetical protein
MAQHFQQAGEEGLSSALSVRGKDFSKVAQERGGMLKSLLRPQQDRDRKALEEKLFRQGRLGANTGGVDQGALEDSIGRQNLQADLAGGDLARGLQQDEFGRGIQLANIGQRESQFVQGNEFRAQESLLGREFQGDQRGLDRSFQGNESSLQRGFLGNESSLQRGFLGSESSLQRGFLGDEAQKGRDFDLELVQRKEALAAAERKRKRKGGFLGAIGSIGGAALGGIFGGPVGAKAGAGVGSALGGLFS